MTQEMWQAVLRRQEEAKKPSRWKKFREDYLTLEALGLKGYLGFLRERIRRDLAFLTTIFLLGYFMLESGHFSTLQIYAIAVFLMLLYFRMVVRPRIKKYIQERR